VSQQAAALAAGIQDSLSNFIETFYHDQRPEHTRYATVAQLDRIREQIPRRGLSEWESDNENSQLTRQVIEDDHAARAISFPTPQ
jgi:hypothetical protein